MESTRKLAVVVSSDASTRAAPDQTKRWLGGGLKGALRGPESQTDVERKRGEGSDVQNIASDDRVPMLPKRPPTLARTAAEVVWRTKVRCPRVDVAETVLRCYRSDVTATSAVLKTRLRRARTMLTRRPDVRRILRRTFGTQHEFGQVGSDRNVFGEGSRVEELG
jgi:hypothetical protein